MNLDVFACVNFRQFDKNGNTAQIYIIAFLTLLSLNGMITVIFTINILFGA